MVRIKPQVDVAVKAGRNRPARSVIKLETVMRQLRVGAPAAGKKPRGLKAAATKAPSAEARRLLADLEKQIRTLRRAATR